MRSDIRTALAALATAAVLMGSATMALAADPDPASPAPPGTSQSATTEPTGSQPTASQPTSPAPSATPSPTETHPTPDVPTGAFTVTDAQMRWGVNDESNNRAFAPGTFNFFSAGKIPDPGRGGVIMPQSSWSQRSGNVSIEKYLDGRWSAATWAGLRTTSTGAAMSGTNGPFSNHEIVISGGTGTVDPGTGTATIQWAGSFTVLYYSGYSFFYVTDPMLTVTDGIGRLTATLSGYGSSMEDLEKWEAVPARPGVVLADLGRVDLAQDLGFSATPAYKGVRAPAGAAQNTDSPSWGSFPESFVEYQTASGTGSYWYSSGGSADAHKVAKPVTISYSAGAPVKVAPPKAVRRSTPSAGHRTRAAPEGQAAPASSPPLPLTGPAPVAPADGTAVRAGGLAPQLRPVSTVIGLRRSDDAESTDALWVLGAVLLLAASLTAASPFAYSVLRKKG
jgi:hypothetical protein